MAVNTSGISSNREPADLTPGIQRLQLAFKQGVLSAEEIANALTTGPSGRQLQRAQNIAALELLPTQQRVAQGGLEAQAAMQPGQAKLAELQLQGQTATAEQGLKMLPAQFQLQELKTQDDVNQLVGLLGTQPFASPENAQSFFVATHPNEKIPENSKKLAEANLNTFKAIQQFKRDVASLQKPHTEELVFQDPVSFDKKKYRITYDAQGNETSRVELGLVESGVKPIPEAQGKAITLSDQMQENEDVVSSLESGGYDPAAAGSQAGQLASRTGFLNPLASVESQQYEAAKENWITAKLRFESGAAISKSEFAGARAQYFPRLGDSPQVIAQKKHLRESVVARMREIGATGRVLPAGAIPTATQDAAKNAAAAPVAQPSTPAVAAPVAPASAPVVIPTVNSAAEADALPPTVQFFRTPNGRTFENPNFKATP